ncbi:MAG: hypothetical protein CMD23_01145 [Flavobacteriales bacterium]|nr:hypothetical protein [Flavobacteriales bacterium]
MDFLLYNVVLNSILVGIILITQFITYPLFQFISSDFKRYHKAYTKRMGYVVAPLMVLELLLVIKITAHHYSNVVIMLIGVLTLIIWASTFLIQVPVHNTISKEKPENKILFLIKSNYIRTLCWILKLILSIQILDVY